jgi:di/tricarboxylate transporter
MTWEAWLTIGTVGLIAVALVRNLAGPDTVLLGGLTLLMTFGLFSDAFPSPAQAVAGFGNEAVITIAVLFVVAEGLSQTGAMSLITQPLLGRPGSVRPALMRLTLPVAFLSAFLNNTPIVAMYMPVVSDWCKKIGIAPSKLFIPLSYAAILGGSCTLIGTATNLFVDGQVSQAQENGELLNVHISMFTVSAIGVPSAILGLIYLVFIAPHLLPDRRTPAQAGGDARQYTVEMIVEPKSPIAGKTIEDAGLRALPGAYLIEIEREGERIAAVGPEQVLHEGDRLIFAGIVDSVVDLQRTRGLVPATDQVFKLGDPRPDRRLVEAVVSDTCPLIRKTIREGKFRTVYGAAVIAVHRGGQHLGKVKIGDIVLKPGDTLLLETHPRFVEAQRNSRDFFLVSTVEGSKPIRHDRAWVALLLMVAMVASVTMIPSMKLVNAALLAAGLMVITGCCSPGEARQSINWRVLLTMGAALGVGVSLKSTGAAHSIAEAIVQASQSYGPRGILIAIYIIGMSLTSLIGPIGTVGLLFPVAKAAAMTQDISFMPFAMALMTTSAASFATPTAYQTNLMVYSAGGYRFTDYVRVGLPLNLIVMSVTVTFAPWFWPF